MQKSRKEAIEYICEYKKGTMNDLIQEIGSDNIKALELTGLIKRGQERQSKLDSWAITETSKRLYIKQAKKEKSFIEKIHHFINYKLMKTTTKPYSA